MNIINSQDFIGGIYNCSLLPEKNHQFVLVNIKQKLGSYIPIV